MLNVSIRCTTQPAFISSYASCAGVAVAAGEVAKDKKHLAAVEKVGFLRNRELLMMMGCALAMFFILTNFQHGRPAYFDVSIRCTTQPTFISSCASCAGVAAAAGEVAKDKKHLAAVEEVFIPLVVETFGVWTPFPLKTLQNIADHTTPRSGVPRKVARKNLLQQLSVQLWSNNAKMILRYWALQGSDDDDNPLFP